MRYSMTRTVFVHKLSRFGEFTLVNIDESTLQCAECGKPVKMEAIMGYEQPNTKVRVVHQRCDKTPKPDDRLLPIDPIAPEYLRSK